MEKGLQGRRRVIIENIKPQVSCGAFPVKRTINEPVHVEADIFADGHAIIDAVLLYRKQGTKAWQEAPMLFQGNDHWKSSFSPKQTGYFEYTIQAWGNHFKTWQEAIKKKAEAGQDISLELMAGIDIINKYIKKENDNNQLAEEVINILQNAKKQDEVLKLLVSDNVSETFQKQYNRQYATTHPPLLIETDRKKALFSTWYELFPRSAAISPGKKHGDFHDVIERLPAIAGMGFDVLYLPPIHPIGISHRKGRNNSVTADKNDPGSPWAIGSKEGGHKAIHPQLGTLKDFKKLIKEAEQLGMEIALDFAIQCSPDHPYIKEHPEWFIWRPDGTIQYAENPPKKYEDVVPLNFETEDWENLWNELKSVLEYWISAGVKIFRVDNPHTKTFAFWQWVIKTLKQKHPDLIFLAEAFTRPRVMEHLAKIGFTQSYTYFTWRNNPADMQQYLEELTKSEPREFYRPNLWPNTPDILHEDLVHGGEPAFITRLILAGTLSASYGIYGPAYEFGLNEQFPGKEEYIHNEKYEIKHWDFNEMTKIKDTIIKLNKIRKENPALQTTWNLHFAESQNASILCYVKYDDALNNILIIAVNMNYHNTQSTLVRIPFEKIKIMPGSAINITDLLCDKTYAWHEEWNYIELNPFTMPAHIFKIGRIG